MVGGCWRVIVSVPASIRERHTRSVRATITVIKRELGNFARVSMDRFFIRAFARLRDFAKLGLVLSLFMVWWGCAREADQPGSNKTAEPAAVGRGGQSAGGDRKDLDQREPSAP